MNCIKIRREATGNPEPAAALARWRRPSVVAAMDGLAVDGNAGALTAGGLDLCDHVASSWHLDRVAAVRAVERVHV
jgi:hypothetical protein